MVQLGEQYALALLRALALSHIDANTHYALWVSINIVGNGISSLNPPDLVVCANNRYLIVPFEKSSRASDPPGAPCKTTR